MSDLLKMPEPDESGCFIPTLNNMGYMTTHLDPFSQAFVEYAAKADNYVLEIGAAYGVATLAALSHGAKVFCNDIDKRHLEIISQQISSNLRANIKLVAGAFPYELDFPENYFSGILICRVLHFFDGDTIDFALRQIHKWLKPQGKVFIVADTPYMKNWQAFIPEYDKGVASGMKWPGLITNPKMYEQKPVENLPSLLHPLDDKILARILSEAGFKIEKIQFINRIDFPPDRRFDGRESVGAIAYKVAVTE